MNVRLLLGLSVGLAWLVLSFVWLIRANRAGKLIARARIANIPDILFLAVSAALAGNAVIQIYDWRTASDGGLADLALGVSYALWGFFIAVAMPRVEFRELGVFVGGALYSWKQIRSWHMDKTDDNTQDEVQLKLRPGRVLLVSRPILALHISAHDRPRVHELLKRHIDLYY